MLGATRKVDTGASPTKEEEKVDQNLKVTVKKEIGAKVALSFSSYKFYDVRNKI